VQNDHFILSTNAVFEKNGIIASKELTVQLIDSKCVLS